MRLTCQLPDTPHTVCGRGTSLLLYSESVRAEVSVSPATTYTEFEVQRCDVAQQEDPALTTP